VRAVADLLASAALPPTARTLGPLPFGDDEVRALVRTPLDDGPDLVAAVKAAQAVRSARKAADFVTVRVDPVEVG
jgi:primosomal protein N' (replication factor Y)